MNDKRYKWILYTIVTVIIVTIGIQVFWNYKNYQSNKQQLINDVQISLDKAVDDYYAALAERTTVGIFLEGDQQKDALKDGGHIQNFLKKIDQDSFGFKNLDQIDINNIEGVTVLTGSKADSMSKIIDEQIKPAKSEDFKKRLDSIKQAKNIKDISEFEILTSKIVVSISSDSLNVSEVDSLLKKEFDRKHIGINSELTFYESQVKRQVAAIKDSLQNKKTLSHKFDLKAVSNSSFLPKGSILELNYSNTTFTVLKRSLVGIVISTFLILAVISCLIYLLKIIKHQKQLAEVKNDLISNITHEFKTPIATIGVALESINNFNAIEDKAKTKNYINMSSQQLEKLNLMVEKLLETATLDSDKLELKKEPIDIVNLISDLSHRFSVQYPEKEFNTSLKVEHLEAEVDIFHFENALNNILDNAVKYGGDMISIDLIPKEKRFEILISDNGNSLSKVNKERVFEKFYRVPKGNTHDVKGFGIGLYYTKSIIEKHGGSINLDLSKNLTTFKITLPNG
ncbi:sensor histidine kinase [Winogradskyella aquimaris]|uniref:histidine kinase n=1 Tax=Winogradskyella aquimaris TaxID=864074 RepID=A0ABU5ELX0_9FLAO|nr:ATP-binding protein [Winogradskyella aquimaris]MDY2585764.1 ATP-binding protein [Winogradskyella aquimaris]